ncbi:nitroreductase family protein [Amnibacterium kyonggiense]|uniref:Nitroreductase n=1 Tax=Amnibacterium kyonggiense TaxID=595671 RepID=A0A4R7FQ86_9MICO|nr:nitroreductase family protein [Amnibacterium kyonggiense]TDS79893.1 nitroreductase [Amnibacterium kyonggiense]
MSTVIPDRQAVTDAPIEEILAMRWSPRSFDANAVVTDEQVTSLLEAARWAASASNAQARRFIVGKRGTETFDRIERHLMGFNRTWAPNASLLVLAIAVVAPDGEQPLGAHRWAEYDLGQSMANLASQAHALGLHAHPMGGIDVAGLQAEFDLPERFLPVTVTAVGTVASPDLLPEKYRERETAVRTRLPLDELVLVRD